uniref:ZP domain-containing protein n=1 Tax=Gongylonema pulchrum TaxID=637853 RepID=A0A183DTJ8_9BILA
LSIRFEDPFHGIIYSEKGFPNCIYVNASILSQTSYTIKVPLDGCETAYNTDGHLENAIVIQESSSRVSESDKKYLLTCIPASTTVRQDVSQLCGKYRCPARSRRRLTGFLLTQNW